MYEMKIYLLNNTKPYSEDEEEYTGAWFLCPVDFDEVKEKLGVESEEEIEVADYELPFSIGTDTPLWEINVNCRMVLSLEGTPLGNEIEAIQRKWFTSFEDFIDHKEEIRHYDVEDSESLARHLLLEEHLCGELSQKLAEHMDYAAFGRELEESSEYLFTTSGVFRYQ
ncbi:MAG: antirestriction protein ArdA [Anaerostipes sp.]|nr:antirestriction protein ArdA [Anaerostipes sp.]